MGTLEIKTGILDPADIALIKEKYQVEVDPDDLKQYKLCMVIKALERALTEAKSPTSSDRESSEE